MSSKLLVIIASGDKEEALTGLMYARNSIKYGWLGDVKIVFFGPSERLIVKDKQLWGEVEDIAAVEEVFACKAICDKEGLSEEMEKLGVKVEYVGSIVSDLIKTGYVPMVW